ncbi:unnamed protein product, partial [Closterium sp. NIES-54]
MFITLYFIVTRLPDSLRSVTDHFLSLDPTSLTVDLLEQHLVAAETSAITDVGAASARAMEARVVAVTAVVVEVAAGVVVEAAVEVVAAVGLLEVVGALVAAVEAAVGVAAGAAVGLVEVGLALGVVVLEVASVSSSSVGARPRRPSSFTCGRSHTQHRCFSRLDDTWRDEFGDDVELLRWADLLKSRIANFDLEFDAIISAMYAFVCASASGSLPGTAPAEALHTFTLDTGASRCFFRDSTTLTPLPARVVARSSTVLRCLADAMVTTTTPGGQRVSICTCTRTGRHLATFTRRPGSSLNALASEPAQVAASTQVSASPATLACPALPSCVEGQQRATPHSSLLPPTIAPLQTLHMDVWVRARISGQSRERYFLQVVDDYTEYTVVFPLRSKGQVVDVLIPWIRTVCLQLRERSPPTSCGTFRGESILHSFKLPQSPQQNGIAERRIGLVMEVARTSMVHVAAPHFLWPIAVQYAAHQLNLWPRVSLPETLPTLRWTGEVDDASVFQVWGSHAFVRDTSADKLSPRAIPCVLLGFVPDAPGWQFHHPTTRRVFPSQDVTFDESVPFYRLFPYSSTPLPPPPLFLVPGPPPVDPLPPQGPARSGVSQPEGAESEGAEVGVAEPGGVASGGAEPEGVEPGGGASEGAESG